VPFNVLPQKLPRGIADPIGRSVAKLGVTPNMVSVFGFGGNVLAAWLITRQEVLWAGIIFIVFSLLDLVDGAIARATGRATPYGAVLDSVLDRASEAVVLVGCAWYFGDRGEWWQVAMTYLALFGSISVSYMRARAEVAGMTMRDGLFRRQERVVALSLGLLFNGLTVVVAVLAVFSNITALQRFTVMMRGLREANAAEQLSQP
jgi:CDP-diacylglycerol--glycerol-3-phosphate 3-phosphatidyltransferase